MAAKTFIVERSSGNGIEKLEIKAERGEQEQGSSRVTFYSGENAIASFINIQGWYEKPAA